METPSLLGESSGDNAPVASGICGFGEGGSPVELAPSESPADAPEPCAGVGEEGCVSPGDIVEAEVSEPSRLPELGLPASDPTSAHLSTADAPEPCASVGEDGCVSPGDIVEAEVSEPSRLPEVGLPASEPTSAHMSTAEPAVVKSISSVSDEAEVDREPCTGLRIASRTVSAGDWAREVTNLQVVHFARIQELSKRKQKNDRIVVGVLYEKSSPGSLANGARYMSWGITDLADPKPRRLKLRLCGEAFTHWRGGKAAASASRGVILAIKNPMLLNEGVANDGMRPSEVAVRVDKQTQLFILGTCSSLGTCNMKNCQLPCNADSQDRFCATHLSLVYAEKEGRISVAGGVSSLDLKDTRMRPRRLVAPPKAPGEDDEGAKEEAALRARERTAAVALQLDDRRFATADSRDDYFKSIKFGFKAECSASSRQPILGRAMEEDDEIELDVATLSSCEKRKAERMLDRHMERIEQKAQGPAESVRIIEDWQAKRPRSMPQPKPEPQKSLSEIMQAMTGKRSARRAGAAAPATNTNFKEFFKPREQTNVDASVGIAGDGVSAGSSATNCASGASGHSVPAVKGAVADLVAIQDLNERARAVVSEAKAAESNSTRLEAVLKSADGLPVDILQGSGLYNFVGKLALHTRPDIKGLAISARRRWRAAVEENNMPVASSAAANPIQRAPAPVVVSSPSAPTASALERGSEVLVAPADTTQEVALPAALKESGLLEASSPEEPCGILPHVTKTDFQDNVLESSHFGSVGA